MQLALNSTNIWLATAPVDFRRSINGLSAIAMEQLGGNPIADSLFIFYNRGRDKLKILGWHRNGYLLLYKRLDQGKFTVPVPTDDYVSISAEQFSWLLAGLDWGAMSQWNNELSFENYY